MQLKEREKDDRSNSGWEDLEELPPSAGLTGTRHRAATNGTLSSILNRESVCALYSNLLHRNADGVWGSEYLRFNDK